MSPITKWYNANGEEAPNAVQIEHDGHLRWMINPAANEEWRTTNGYTFSERPEQPEEEPVVDESYLEALAEFRDACLQFRHVCSKIGEAINKPTFRGGFEELLEFQQSEVYSSIAGLCLAMEWNGANELCKYLGSKVGMGQPQWWRYCWEEMDAANTDESVAEEHLEEPQVEEHVEDELPEVTPEEEIQE